MLSNKFVDGAGSHVIDKIAIIFSTINIINLTSNIQKYLIYLSLAGLAIRTKTLKYYIFS